MMQIENHTFASLQLDISIPKQEAQYLIDAHNIRITAREGETLLSVTNELGPKELKLVNSYGDAASIFGTIIGHCTINEYLVLFTTGETENHDPLDCIYRIDMSKEDPEVFVLYSGEGPDSLNFSVDHPIEAITDYENENIQKVYWTDGINLPRVINIKTNIKYKWNGTFDFVPSLQLAEEINITRDTNASGMFASGVIQYAFTYYNKYGQESNIFYVSPLNYISHYDRGGSSEDVISVAFKINVRYFDSNFDYLRIYSIHRTSLDAIPTCKRVQDIDILSRDLDKPVTFTDNGTIGEIVDPSSLLYKGGEEIKASNICAKDGTLFLGNISFLRPSIKELLELKFDFSDSGDNKVTTTTQEVVLTKVSESPYEYYNGLNTQSAGFKNREYYRLGLQALYKNGKWSDPIHLTDYLVLHKEGPSINNGILKKLTISITISDKQRKELSDAGYKKVRPVVVFPESQDRTVICQGVSSATLFTISNRDKGSLYALSSWFFRPHLLGVSTWDSYVNSKFLTEYGSAPFNAHKLFLPYTDERVMYQDGSRELYWSPLMLRGVEILGQFDANNLFILDWDFQTLHSPEITFSTDLYNRSLANVSCRRVGIASITNTIGDINILTSSPTISSKGSGFVHTPYTSKYIGVSAGLHYEDYLVDDVQNKDNSVNVGEYINLKSPVKWMVYPWHKNGSLNNDINRSVSTGLRSANLSKKVISNLRWSNTIWETLSSNDPSYSIEGLPTPQIFNSNEVSIIKLGLNIYKGNIDTLLSPDDSEGHYFAFGNAEWPVLEGFWGGPETLSGGYIQTPISSTAFWKTQKGSTSDETPIALYWRGLFKAYNIKTESTGKTIWRFDYKHLGVEGEVFPDLIATKEPVRMKYKSTPHMVLSFNENTAVSVASVDNKCALPILEIYKEYDRDTAFGGESDDAFKANKWLPAGEAILLADLTASLNYTWGDTWFARYDCLKTYPFTFEDTNLIVEIGSFMLETRINIDGRYDRNRGLADNTNMSPINFNLFNPVYSQRDNFFTYRILDDDYYKLNLFPNLITWSTLKTAGQDVDPWTTVTLAATFDMDGSKGLIRALKVWNDNIYCFLDNEVSAILFNSRVQIPTSDGVPIEIANNYKVDGKRCVLDGSGCVNKYAICPTPMALYFIDSVGGHLLAIGANGLTDLSASKNMVTWISKLDTSMWKPNKYTTKLFYDRNNKDIYITTEKESLCYSEMIGEFISFMSYSNIPVMFNVIDKFYCVKGNYISLMFAGEYNYFFGEYKGYDITFVSNGKTSSGDMSTIDKIYTNIEFRADKWSDKLNSILSLESPFDYIRVWNEYLDTGEVLLLDKPNKPSPLKKKFRVWRILIPRDAHNRRDRIRNTWCKIKLGASPKYNSGNNNFILLHDAAVQFVV